MTRMIYDLCEHFGRCCWQRENCVGDFVATLSLAFSVGPRTFTVQNPYVPVKYVIVNLESECVHTPKTKK